MIWSSFFSRYRLTYIYSSSGSMALPFSLILTARLHEIWSLVMEYCAMLTSKHVGKQEAVKKRRLGTSSMSCHGVDE